MKKLGKNIKAYREAIGMSPDTLSRLLGVDTKTVDKWERGSLAPTDKEIYYIACALNISEDTLRGTTPPPPPKKDEGVLGQPDGIYGESEKESESETARTAPTPPPAYNPPTPPAQKTTPPTETPAPPPAPEQEPTRTQTGSADDGGDDTLDEMRRLLKTVQGEERESRTPEDDGEGVSLDGESVRFPSWFPDVPSSGEKLLWTATPSTSCAAAKGERRVALIALVVSVFPLILGFVNISTMFIPLIIGILGVFFSIKKLSDFDDAAKATHYALTNKRLVIVSGKRSASFKPSEIRYCATVGKDNEGYASVMMAKSGEELDGKKLPVLKLGPITPTLHYIKEPERLVMLIGRVVRANTQIQ